MKILIVNQHTNNFGDDAAGTALVNRLLQSGVKKIELLYCMPGFLPIDDNRVTHNHKLNVRELRRIDFALYWFFGIRRGNFISGFVSKLKEYDMIMVSPCGANLGIYRDWQLLFQDLIVVKNRKKLVFHLNTISPSGNKLFDRLVQYVCKRSSVYVREKRSQQYLKKAGIPAKWGPDSAFMLESRGRLDHEEGLITFVPSDVWSWHVDFIGKRDDSFYDMVLKPIAKFAKAHKKDIYILAHTNSKSENEFNSNIKSELENMAPEIKVVIPEIKTVYDYERYISSSYLLIGMRYHSVVLAAKNAVPFICIAYEQKMKEVSEYTNQLKYCVDLKHINQNIPLDILLEDITEKYTIIRQNLASQNRGFINGANIVIQEQICMKEAI